jgi:hypothetical protein
LHAAPAGEATLQLKTIALAAALLPALLCATPALAQDAAGALMQPASLLDSIDELRFGGAFHRAYPRFIPAEPGLFDFSRPEDVTFDVLFRSPDVDAFAWIGSPRPEIGTTISLTGHESIVHLGLTWQVHLFDAPVYVEGTFGGALNNGYLDNAPQGYANMGCRLGFYERFGIGVDLPSNMTATLSYEHTSNLELCDRNDGLSNVALKLGWKF